MKINDFGEKIGGARKDLWRNRGLDESDLYNMNDAEKKKYVVRDSIWPLPDAKKQVEEGLPCLVAYWQREIRKQVYKEPVIRAGEDFNDKLKYYIHAVKEIRNLVMEVKSEDDISAFYRKIQKMSDTPGSVRHWEGVVNTWRIWRMRYSLSSFRTKMEKANFPYGKKTAVKKPRKKSFIPPQLTHIEREGIDYRHGKNVTPDIWQREFSFRGIEFGNWMTQADRQSSMNYCFDALKDLADVLLIEDADIAFNGQLALAFGARGCSRASAHYEQLREVINLTKMHGAGCTAHEWFHALDDKLAKFCGITDGKFASETMETNKLPKTFVRLKNYMKEDADGNKTDYYVGSKAFGSMFAKESHGAWDSETEMLARAFACYVKDCHGKNSDYLIAHADSYLFEFDNQGLCAIPQDEERELYNEMFDQLFFELKEIGFFHERLFRPEKGASDSKIYVVEEKKYISAVVLHEECNGQMRLCL